MARLTRRQSLAALIGGGAAVSVLGAGMFGGEANLVRSILSRVIGPFTMSDVDLSSFIADLETKRGTASEAKFALFRALSLSGPENMLPYAPAGLRDRFESYERQVVTNFMTRTDYVQIDPKTQHVSFVGDASCHSPFAVFDRT